jgi:drug/metabolite transporter (DMT)-like permease
VILSLAWLVVGLSIGAVALLMVLLRRPSTTRTLSLLYLVPPLAAAEAWWVFGETLGIAALVGIALAAAGVALVQRSGGR